MLPLCWFYCIPLGVFVFYALAPACYLMSFFVLKRGRRTANQSLRVWAIIMMLMAAIKVFLIDLRLLKKPLLCGIDAPFLPCTRLMMQVVDVLGLLALLVSSYFLFLLYQRVLPDPKHIPTITPEQNNLRFWANMAAGLSLLLIVWTLAPWIGYLTVGSVPDIFAQVPWQPIAVLGLVFLVIGFWKLEDCQWFYGGRDRRRLPSHANKMWTARDTLWTTVWVYLVTVALAYVTQDVAFAK